MRVGTDVRLADGDHVVQFYEADHDLVGAVVGYLSGAVVDGESVVVIATAEHCAAFESALRDAGIDVVGAQAAGRLTVLDAAETLSRFMVDDAPDPAAFDAVVGRLVRQKAGEGSVRAYGEMVALLWDTGLVTAAIELERLWNRLGERTSFSLFCGYPSHMVSDALSGEQFAAVCDMHSAIVAGSPVPAGAEVTRRFPRSTHAPRLARRFVGATLDEWGLRGLVDDAVFVVAELAANAVEHARSDFTVGMSRTSDGIRIEVADSALAAPRRREAHATDVRGRGLMLVAELSHRWGHRLVADGKIVWADLREPHTFAFEHAD